MRFPLLPLAGLSLSLALLATSAPAEKVPTILGQPIDPKQYKGLVEAGYLPLKPELTDSELADKLDLKLPQLAAVRAALAAKEAKALRRALADYLDSKLPPLKVTPTGKPPANAR